MPANFLLNVETKLLIEALKLRYGYDFTHYAGASLRRRVAALPGALGLPSISDIVPKLVHDESFLPQVLSHLSVPVTSMFRDPDVFLNIRTEIIPFLRSYPQIKIWQAGSATGEEAYSLAILLEEEGLYDRTQIYSTDINDLALAKAEEGVFSSKLLKEYENNYRLAGGKVSFLDYYTEKYNLFRMSDAIRRNIVFSHHNLVSDGVFCEVNLILCRNVLIYFDRPLQNRVLNLFFDALRHGGFLCLGTRESMRFTEAQNNFTQVMRGVNLFRKIARAA
jgi:chemotaxis protein methyltransferase CheR